MADRETRKVQFLQTSGWADGHRSFLAGDASARSYERLVHPKDGTTMVLMDAPPDDGEDTRPFVTVARYLRHLGLSAPEIIAVDEVNGFVLLEDLGDDLFARLCKATHDIETELYEAAVDVMVKLHLGTVLPDLPPYDRDVYLRESRLLTEWYIPAVKGTAFPPHLEAEFAALMTELTDGLSGDRPVTVLRDYHAENLLWLPERDGTERLGLLDFQDALAGHPAYDLVSLLEDARRDTTPDLRNAMKDRFVQATSAKKGEFERDYAVLGAQRNLKIIGIFARLCIRDTKAGYVDLIPRVWDHLMNDLMHPDLSGLREFVNNHVPPPLPGALDLIRKHRP